MPRDDLTIDFIRPRGMMTQPGQAKDVADVLEDFVNRAANLPHEIAHFQEEIEHKDRQVAECMAIITKQDNAIQKWIKQNGSHTPNPKEENLRKIIEQNYDKAEVLSNEKVALALKSQALVKKHINALDKEIEILQARGEMPKDPDLPSSLGVQSSNPRQSGTRVDHAVAAMPLGPINNSASMVHARHPNQHPQRMVPAHAQAQQISAITSASAPATPTASMLLQRQARESSLGLAAANKRQRLIGALGALPPSNLANRASSNAPGTPGGRSGTPVSVTARAGSAGPRVSQKTTKKVAPQGSRQSGQLRKPIKKSGLGRIKRAGHKNSPSTNDELSEAASGSEDEDEEAVTPPRKRDADGDDEMGDGDDDDGGDNNKYCMCQSVSYGDMVACDNEACPFEWFHWTCVGLKSEPIGVWICPVCTEKGFGK